MLSTLELGESPMPSTAVTKADMGHDVYGDVSVLFRKDIKYPRVKNTKKALHLRIINFTYYSQQSY